MRDISGIIDRHKTIKIALIMEKQPLKAGV